MTLLERLINWNRATKNDGDLFLAEFDRLYTNCQTLKTGVETETADRQQADGSLQTAIDGKRNILDSYSKTETDTALLGKRDVSDSYSQTEIDTKLQLEADTIGFHLVQLQGQIDDRIEISEKGVPNGVASLNANGIIPPSQIPQKPTVRVVSTVADRDTNYTPPIVEGVEIDGYMIMCLDASADPTVTSGWATYIWMLSNQTWIKIAEGESIDAIVEWSNITGKPLEFTPSAHIHAIADVSNLQTALDGKSNTGHTHLTTDITDLTVTTEFIETSAHPIGEPFSVWDTTLTGHPINKYPSRYIRLSAGLTGTGQYNENKLTTEQNEIINETRFYSANISVVGSPMNGQTVRLINSTKNTTTTDKSVETFLGAGETAGVRLADQIQGFRMRYDYNNAMFTVGASTLNQILPPFNGTAIYTIPETNAVNGTVRTGFTTNPVTVSTVYYMRII